MDDPGGPDFDAFVEALRPRLARAFVSAYGLDRGQDALAEALGYAWEHYDRVRTLENPAGYLYRVGQSRTRRRRTPVRFPSPAERNLPEVEPRLSEALNQLTEQQRVCVVLAHVYEWTHQEVANLLGLRRSSVQSHIERGLDRLRRLLGVVSDA